jgi:hypothetical protein
MPQIREYEQQTSAQVETPGRRAEAGGRELSTFGSGLAKVGEILSEGRTHIRAQEVRADLTDLHADMSKANLDLTTHLMELEQTWDPKDSIGLGEKYQESVRAYIDGMGAKARTLEGRQYFKREAADLSSRLMVESGRVEARLVGVRATQAALQMVDAERNVLWLDPTQFDNRLQFVQRAIEDPKGLYAGMPAADRVKLLRSSQEQMALSAIQGLIQIDGELGKKAIKSGRFSKFLDADKTAVLQSHAEVAIRGKLVEEDRVLRREDRMRKDAQKSTGNDFFGKLMKDELAVGEITRSNLDATGENSKEHWTRLLEWKSKLDVQKPIARDPSTFLDVLNRIRHPEAENGIRNESQIEEIFAQSVEKNRGLSWEDTVKLRKEFQDLRTPAGERLSKTREAFLKSVQPQLDHSTPIKNDPVGRQKTFEFGEYVDSVVEEYRAAGKDPHILFNPKHPDYLGDPKVIEPYKRTMLEVIKSMKEGMYRGNVKMPQVLTPDKMRKPGESYPDWRKRQQ